MTPLSQFNLTENFTLPPIEPFSSPRTSNQPTSSTQTSIPNPQPIKIANQTPSTISFTPAFTPLTITSNILPPSLPSFNFSNSSNPSHQISTTQKNKRAKSTPSPKSVQLEFLNKELTIAKTKIATLENDLKRKNEKCKLQEDIIKSLEHPTMSNLFNQYLPQSHFTKTKPNYLIQTKTKKYLPR